MNTLSPLTPLVFAALPALAALACTTPLRSPTTLAESTPPATPPDAATAPPVPTADASRRSCTLMGCFSEIDVAAHLPASPAELEKSGSFHLCHQTRCWDGTFLAPSAPGRETCKASSSPLPKGWCHLEPEGAGTRFSVGIWEGDFADGDRVSLRVTVGDKRPIDVERHVTYAVSTPNGPGCGPVCKGAYVELWPGSRSGLTCASQLCDGVVSFTSTLPRTRDGAPGTVLTACKNKDCKTSSVFPLWHWDEANDRPLTIAQAGSGVNEIDGSTMTVRAKEGATPTSPMSVTFEFHGDQDRYKNGDEYSVEWKIKTGRLLLSERRVVTYDEIDPGGPGCSVVLCKRKVF